MIVLNDEQKKTIETMLSGKNIFLTGPGGRGKSVCLKEFVNKCKELSINVSVTASTGVAAINISGTTLHHFIGAGLLNGEPEVLAQKILKNKNARTRWNQTSVLIIDEISMIKASMFDKFEKIARLVRKKNTPFGGIQVILCGDMGQLPPVCRDDEEDVDSSFIFKSKSWQYITDHIILTKNMRQKDDETFSEILNKIRVGDITDFVRTSIDSRIGIKPDSNNFIKIYTHNIDVNVINKNKLNKLIANGETEHTYKSTISIKPGTVSRDYIVKNMTCDETLSICKDCKVMLLCNMDVENKLVNGSIGFVSSFTETNEPIVNFNGVDHVITKYTWEIEEHGKKLASIIQYPLKLAYGCTTHKTQSMTFDNAVMNLSKSFGYGMIYTALSRVRTLGGLFLEGRIDWDNIKIYRSEWL